MHRCSSLASLSLHHTAQADSAMNISLTIIWAGECSGAAAWQLRRARGLPANPAKEQRTRDHIRRSAPAVNERACGRGRCGQHRERRHTRQQCSGARLCCMLLFVLSSTIILQTFLCCLGHLSLGTAQLLTLGVRLAAHRRSRDACETTLCMLSSPLAAMPAYRQLSTAAGERSPSALSSVQGSSFLPPALHRHAS